jgi:menaquinone-specific isochorismate synthase
MNLLDKNPNSFIFAYYKKGKTFLGATPEILVEKKEDAIISYALAGTIARDEEDDEKQKTKLLKDCKNCYEHQVVIDTITSVMKSYSHQVIVDETKILTSKICITCKRVLPLRITEHYWSGSRLHPTPALGGNPVHKALELIAKYEKHERGLYAAPIGIIKQNGDGIFVAGIRSALIHGKEISAYTGCGIVEKSGCEDEYLETNNKLRTILESL